MNKVETKSCCVPISNHEDIGTSNVRIAPSLTPPDHGLIALNAGTFTMGADDGPHPGDGEGPARKITLDAFAIAPLTVTNGQFQAFIQETRYKTVA